MNVERDLERIGPWLGLAGLVACTIIGLATRQPAAPGLAVPAAVVTIGAAVVIARFGPRPSVLIAALALASAGVAVVCAGRASNSGWFGLCVLAAWTILAAGPRIGIAYVLGAAALLGGEALWGIHDPGWAAWTVGLAVSAGASAAGGHERRLLTQLRAAQAGLAERSRVQERDRISRELHDVIAHNLTVTLLHVSSARLAVEHDPQDAVRALAEAERLGRQSLDEVRSIVGAVRSGPEAASLAPVPGAESLDELIARFRSAGLAISFSQDGQLARMPATAGTTVYRILQEALTNTAKHGGGAPVGVRIAQAGARLELVVDSGGAPGDGHGMGLATMRERAEALGGGCDAGPSGDGWQVRAWLPNRVGAR